MIRFALNLTVIAAMFLTVAAIAKAADRPPQFPVKKGVPHVQFGPRNVSEAVENMTLLATCQWVPSRCTVRPEPHPSARKRRP